MQISRVLTLAALMAASGAAAQQAGVGRTDLLQRDLGVAGREVIQVRVDIAPGVTAARHSHPGVEVAYVLEGALEYRIDGRAPEVVKAGGSLFIPAGAIHAARNVGSGTARELATYVVEKGKPLVVAAP